MRKSDIKAGSFSSRALMFFQDNGFINGIINFLFKNINFDSESLATLKEHAGRGRVVYVSYQNSAMSVLLLKSLLNKHGFPLPKTVIDFRPSLFQLLEYYIKTIPDIIEGIISKQKKAKINEHAFIEKSVISNNGLVLSLLSPELFIKRYVDIKSDSLQYLVDAQDRIDEPILIFPQIMFWNRNPERSKTFFTSRATGDRGIFSALFTFFKSATPAFMRIAPPINLKEEKESFQTDDSKHMAARLRNKLLEIYSHEKRSILGPVIKSRQEMMEKVLYHKNVLDLINSTVRDTGAAEGKLRRRAYEYFREIAADFSIVYIRLFERTMRYIYDKVFNGIIYSIEDIKMIREASQKGPLIIMPAHKSHMDYLIVSSIFYREKIIPPHIVAGSNLTFFPMGKIFRRSGAFFMRRSFKGLDLYAMVFKQYIKTLISEGYSIEFFIEGGRSRTGKLVLPKMGILKYLINAIDEGYNRDMIFLPVSVNYDRILEEASYSKEMMGKEKRDENTSTLVKSSKLLKRKYGRVYLSFGKPTGYQELKNQLPPDADLTAEIGNYIIRKINDIIMVTPFSLTSAALLLSDRKGFTRDAVKKNMEILHEYLAHSGARLSESISGAYSFDEIINYVFSSFGEDKIISAVESEGERGSDTAPDLYHINEYERPRIAFYKNNIIHYLLPGVFVALSLIYHQENKKTGLQDLVDFYGDVMSLFSKEFVFPDAMADARETVEKVTDYFIMKSLIKKTNRVFSINQKNYGVLIFYAKLVREFLESYFIVFDSVEKSKKRTGIKDLMSQIRKNGITKYNLGEINSAEALSLPIYTNAVEKCFAAGYIKELSRNKKDAVAEIEITGSDDLRDMKKKISDLLRKITEPQW